MDKLDLKDKKILFHLDLNARQSDKEIAKKVGLSRDSVRYRISKLVEEGYINYFMVLLNTMKLGYNWYRTFFKFQNLTIKKEEEIIDYLKERVSWITKVEGIWDINTGVFCKNIYEFRDILNGFVLRYGGYIKSYEVAIVTREWNYHRDYLLNRKQKQTEPQLMGFNNNEEYKIEDIDEMDYKILEVLLKNARMKTIDIARKLKTTEVVVRYRIKKLTEKGIILGFKPFLNIHKMGYQYFKIHFALQNLTIEKKKQILSYVHAHPNTLHTTELVGGDDLETEFQVRNNEEFYEYIKEMRLKFDGVIKDYKFMQYTQEYKFTYLPEKSIDIK